MIDILYWSVSFKRQMRASDHRQKLCAEFITSFHYIGVRKGSSEVRIRRASDIKRYGPLGVIEILVKE